MEQDNLPPTKPKRLPLALLDIEAGRGDDFEPCDECEDPEECQDEGYCELGLID